jgi:hypothetical protein
MVYYVQTHREVNAKIEISSEIAYALEEGFDSSTDSFVAEVFGLFLWTDDEVVANAEIGNIANGMESATALGVSI